MHGKVVSDYNSQLRKEGFGQMELRPEMRRRMFQLIDESVPRGNDRHLSIVLVREPFSRIVSSYTNTMVGDWFKSGHDMRWMRDAIIKTYVGNWNPNVVFNWKATIFRYRGIDPKSTGDAPTPTEFVQYIIDQAETVGPYRLDNHIKPMWTACPFCLVQFDVIGHIEEFDLDSLFILENMNLTVIFWKGDGNLKQIAPIGQLHKILHYCPISSCIQHIAFFLSVKLTEYNLILSKFVVAKRLKFQWGRTKLPSPLIKQLPKNHTESFFTAQSWCR
jgi:hypothetical protein